jgi:hypothetical protein
VSQIAPRPPAPRRGPSPLNLPLRLKPQYPSEQAGRPLRRRGTTRRRLVLRGVAIAGLVGVIGILAFVLVMLTGQTEFGLIRDRVAGLIRDGVGPGYQVDIRRAVIDIDPVLGFTVRIDDIEVRDSNQAVVAHVPSTRFAVDPTALLAFKVVVRQVELSNPEVSFVRAADGAIYLGNAATARAGRGEAAPIPDPVPQGIADGGFPEIIAALYEIDRAVEPQLDAAIRAGFERFAIVNATAVVWDAGRGSQRRFPGTDLNVTVDAATGGVSAAVGSAGFGGRWTATAERVRESSSGARNISVTLSQLMLADLVPGLGDDEALFAADIPLYGRANIRMTADGAIADATARLDFGAGVMRFGEERERVLLDEATVKLRWDVANRTLVLEPSTYFFGETRGVLGGRIYPVGEPEDRRYAFEFESPGAVLAPRDSGEAPIIAQRMALSGEFDLKAGLLNFDNAVIVAGDAAVAATGSLDFEGPTPSLVMAATFSPMSISAMKQLWVPLIAPGARRWVMEHVGSGGRLVSGRYEASIPPGVLWTGKRPILPDEAMRLDMRLEGITFKTFGKLPPIGNASGNVVVQGSTVGIDIESGEIATRAGTVSVVAGAFAVPNTAKRPADGLIELQLVGGAEALGEIGNAEPLLALERVELVPSDLSGEATANVSIRMPLRDGLTEGDVDWRVVINTDGVASKKPVEGRAVSDADVQLTITPNEVAIYGKARIDGAVADVAMAFPIGVAAAGPGSDRRVRLLLDDEARKRFGVGLEGVLSGSIAALVSDAPDGVSQLFDLDLRRARVVLPGIGWTKGVGVPGRLTFSVRPDSGGYAVDDIVLEGDGFGFAGTARLDESYNLASADITRMSLRAGDSIAMKLTRSRTGYAITARGSSFDLRGMMSQVRDRNDQAGGFPDIAVDAQIDRLVGFNQEVITGASLTLVSVGGETQKIAFSGALGPSAIALNYAVAPDGTTLTGSAADAGRLMRFTDLYTRMTGGTVRLSGQGGRAGPMLGSMEVTDFYVVDEPAMDRVAVGPSDPRSFNPRRVHFDRAVAQFRRSDRVVIIEDALVAGASVGATFSGRYDLSQAHINMTGTYLPAYALNNLFGQVPILGLVLGGGMREGLIGVTFKIEGPISQPQVFFNPLSAVAPGMFRKIFEFQRPTQ